jgi:hypothetical protein
MGTTAPASSYEKKRIAAESSELYPFIVQIPKTLTEKFLAKPVGLSLRNLRGAPAARPLKAQRSGKAVNIYVMVKGHPRRN